MDSLISIVVPVYNVEQYLDTCMKSIVSQTYQNIEILLVDDGSPDNCGVICDGWAKEDARILSLHKDNGGLASARNYGLRYAHGEYVLFVDSDDWIEPDAVQQYADEAEHTGADIVIASYVKHKNGKEIVHDIGQNRLYTSQKALYEVIIDKRVNNFAWNFLCKKSLYDEISYPAHRRKFEDLDYTYKLFRKANRIAHINAPVYHYIRREDSILGGWELDVALAFVVAQQIRFEDLSTTHPELAPVMMRGYYSALASAKKHAASSAKKIVRENASTIRSEIRPFYRRHRKALKQAKRISYMAGLANSLFLTFPTAYCTLARKGKQR